MTREEFKTYQMLREKFSEYCNDIFSYIKKNYISVLSFAKYSEFSNAECYPNDVTFNYYDSQDFVDTDLIQIPTNDFLANPYEWVDKWANKLIAEKEATRQRLDEIALQKERNEYERLKKKFETT